MYLRIDGYVGRWTRLRVRADGRGNNPTIDVVPPNPGSRAGVLVTLAGQSRLCVVFDAATGSKVGTNTKEEFTIRHGSPHCPAAP